MSQSLLNVYDIFIRISTLVHKLLIWISLLPQTRENNPFLSQIKTGPLTFPVSVSKFFPCKHMTRIEICSSEETKLKNKLYELYFIRIELINSPNIF